MDHYEKAEKALEREEKFPGTAGAGVWAGIQVHAILALCDTIKEEGEKRREEKQWQRGSEL